MTRRNTIVNESEFSIWVHVDEQENAVAEWDQLVTGTAQSQLTVGSPMVQKQSNNEHTSLIGSLASCREQKD